MTNHNVVLTIDVRELAPRLRHPTIFNTFNALAAGQALLIINDHDPVPLYYQFAGEYVGSFHWEYLEQGPETWRVRISRGEFADPGFVPARKLVRPVSAPIEFVQPLVLDVRPLLAAGESPCGAIDTAVAQLIPGQLFVLLAPFEPRPLYAKLGQQGFTHQTKPLEDGSWRVEFRRNGPAPVSGPTAEAGCGCGGH